MFPQPTQRLLGGTMSKVERMGDDDMPSTYAQPHGRESFRARGQDATRSQYQIEV